MSWTHSSKILALGLAVALALGVVGTATAVTFDDSGVPSELEVGEQESVTVTMDDPFENQPDSWTLQASSELQSSTINIRAETVGGDTITGNNGQITLSTDDAIQSVEIEATGTVPETPYNYEEPEQEEFVGLSVSGEGVQEQWSVTAYTEESKTARERIEEAAGIVSSDNSDLQSAISLYNSGDFEQATTEADSIINSQESEEQTQTLLIGGAAVVILLAVLGGGFYVYSQKKKNTNKLQ